MGADLGVNERGEQIVELVGGFIPVSAEGKARARQKLADAAARTPPDTWAKLREQLGLPAQSTRSAR